MEFRAGDTVMAHDNKSGDKVKFIIIENETATAVNRAVGFLSHKSIKVLLIEKNFPTQRPYWGWIEVK